MFDIYDYTSGPAIANEKTQTGKRQPCLFHLLSRIFTTVLLQNTRKSGQPADDVDRPPYMFFYRSLIKRVSERSRVCGIATVESL